MPTRKSCELGDPILIAGRTPSVKLWSLEKVVGYCSLQSLGVQHRSGLTEDSESGEISLHLPMQGHPGWVWGLQATQRTTLFREERQAAEPLVWREPPSQRGSHPSHSVKATQVVLSSARLRGSMASLSAEVGGGSPVAWIPFLPNEAETPPRQDLVTLWG